MSPKSAATNNGNKRAKTAGKAVIDLNDIIQKMNKKEAYTPLYLLRYDD
jgi:hypothetical protein